MRLSTRITIALTLLAPLMVLAAGALLTTIVAHDLRTQQDQRLQTGAASVTTTAQRLLSATITDHRQIQRLEQQSLATAALDLGIRLGSPTVSDQQGPQPPTSVQLPAPDRRIVSVSGGGTSYRAIGRTISSNGRTADLWVFSSDAPTDEAIRSLTRTALIVAALTVPLAALAALLVSRRATRSLRALQRRTADLDPADSGTRTTHTRSGVAEVDALAHTLDVVLARYDEQAARTDQALRTARSFSAAASHELRNPLMSMQTNLEVLAAHPDLDPADRGEILDDLHDEHRRILGTLTLLRALAQGDLVQAAEFEPVDLAELISAAVADARKMRPDAAISVQAGEPALLRGWHPGLRMVLDNLLTNAMVHGADRPTARPRVEVALHRERDLDGPTAVLTIADHGPGVPPEQREEVFGLFRRRPDSPGSGLGLTLVAQQVALHHGMIRITDPPAHRGARFEIRLPLDREHPTVPLPVRRDWLTDPTDPAPLADALTRPLPRG